MWNKTHITVLAWLRTVKLSPSSRGRWMSNHKSKLKRTRTVWNGVLTPDVGISIEHDNGIISWELLETREWSSVLTGMGAVLIPSPSLPPSPGKGEAGNASSKRAQSLKAWGRQCWPRPAAHYTHRASPMLAGPAVKLKPQGQDLKPYPAHPHSADTDGLSW